MTTEPNDFYETDEPIEKIRAAFDAGRKGKTARPVDQIETWVSDSVLVVTRKVVGSGWAPRDYRWKNTEVSVPA